MFHGTSRALGLSIERQGLKASGCSAVSEEFRKSCYSEPNYIYFTDDMEMAKLFACGTTKKVGIGNYGQIFEIDTKEVKVETDTLLPRGSFRHKGDVPASKLKSIKIMKC